ncbi:MAG: alanine racemase [Caedibacter sp. 38-128]|nr:alanine racemase [Holosporales bacterium]OJX04678.1 MAG: alanine racemase [Caedibacter sp. 38-128]
MIRLNLKALKHNISQIKSIAPKSKFLAVVKDNAYGHGIETITKEIIDDVEGFGVVSLKEALVVRRLTSTKPIILMQGANTRSELTECFSSHLTVLIHNLEQIQLLNSLRIREKLAIWIKINCGLNRLGFNFKDFKVALGELKKSQNVNHDNMCIMSHLSSVSSSNKISKKEIAHFSASVKGLPFEKSLASSAAILKYPETHYDWIRPGLLMYGVSPLSGREKLPLSLKPVMNLVGHIISIHSLSAGENVGYNRAWICKNPTNIAIINIGYADGYPFHIGKSMPVLIRGSKRAHIIGRVSSDAIAVELTTCRNVKIGDEVTLWGEGLPVEEIASKANTIPDQLLCAAGQRAVP